MRPARRCCGLNQYTCGRVGGERALCRIISIRIAKSFFAVVIKERCAPAPGCVSSTFGDGLNDPELGEEHAQCPSEFLNELRDMSAPQRVTCGGVMRRSREITGSADVAECQHVGNEPNARYAREELRVGRGFSCRASDYDEVCPCETDKSKPRARLQMRRLGRVRTAAAGVSRWPPGLGTKRSCCAKIFLSPWRREPHLRLLRASWPVTAFRDLASLIESVATLLSHWRHRAARKNGAWYSCAAPPHHQTALVFQCTGAPAYAYLNFKLSSANSA